MTTPNLSSLRDALVALTPAQQAAADTLAAGGTHREAADAAGVARETVTRWSGHLPAFRAALNLYRSTSAAEQIDAVHRVRGKALAAIEAALDEGTIDPVPILRLLAAPSTPIGPTVPEAILDSETNKTRGTLPPVPRPRTFQDQLDQLYDPPPSGAERAETITITRLATSAGLTTPPQLDESEAVENSS